MSGRPPLRGPADRRVLSGPAFFDDARIFRRYQELRAQADAAHLTIERPFIVEFLGDVRGRAVLDLGCGDAWIGKYVLDRGAARYVGVDGSRRMIDAASRALAATSAELILEDLETWCPDDRDRFDIAVSRLTLQYIRNLRRLLHTVRDRLLPGGLFVASIEHPLLTSSFDGESVDGIARAWRVSGYFREGDRDNEWLDAVVLKQHRTLATYFDELRASGFQLDRFSEGQPERSNFEEAASFDRRRDVPMCAIFRMIRHD
jgi:SAM-dependent methyltransferase